MQRQVRECWAEVLGWVSVWFGVDGVPRAVRRVHPRDRADGRRDPWPGVGGKPAAAAGIEPVDGGDQAERARLDGLVEGFATEAQVVRTQRHESQALADEVVSRAAIARPSGVGECAFTIRLERRLGQQVTRKGFHWISVDAALINRRIFTRECGQVRAGDVAQVRIGTRLTVLRAASGGRYVMRGRRGRSMSRPFFFDSTASSRSSRRAHMVRLEAIELELPRLLEGCQRKPCGFSGFQARRWPAHA